MATLYFEDGQATSDWKEIQDGLSDLGIELHRWTIDSTTQQLLQKDSLTDVEKEMV